MVQIRKMLEMKRAEVGLRVVTEQRRLALLQARLEQVEREDGLLAYEVALKRVDAQRVASVLRGGEQDNPYYITKIQFPVAKADLREER
jgi:hypothetical protein